MAPRLARRLLALGAALVLGAACARLPLSPAKGGPPWFELSSPRFLLRTDVPMAEARRALAEFEKIHRAFLDLGSRLRQGTAEQVEVVLFSSFDEYRAFGLPRADAHFTLRDLDNRPTVVMAGPYGERARAVFQHELTHRFVTSNFPQAPPWLQEGMARFYETLRFEDDAVVIGGPNPCRALYEGLPRPLPDLSPACRTGWTHLMDLPSVEALRTAPPATFRDARRMNAYYAGAWVLVHLLILEEAQLRQRFIGFLARLGSGVAPNEAWTEAFQGFDPGKLESLYRAYPKRKQIRIQRLPYRAPTPPPPSQQRTMSDPEVHLLWASLVMSFGPAGQAKAAEHVREALRAAPQLAEAQYWNGRVLANEQRFDEAERALRAALAERPAEPRYVMALAKVFFAREPATVAGQVRLRSIEPLVRGLAESKDAFALDFAARFYGRLGEFDRGLSLARRALESAPACSPCAATMAWLFAANGRPREAVSMQRRALRSLPMHAPAKPLLDLLRIYEQAAARQPAP